MKYLFEKTIANGNRDTDAFQHGLLELRNTPGSSGQSPAQLLCGRPLFSFVLAHGGQFHLAWQEIACSINDSELTLSRPMTHLVLRHENYLA